MQNTRKTRKSYIVAFMILAIMATIVAVIRANQKSEVNPVELPVSSDFVRQFEENGSHKILNNWIARKYPDGFEHLNTEHSVKGDTITVNTDFIAEGKTKHAKGTFINQGRVLELDID